jgi:hypothetical protein
MRIFVNYCKMLIIARYDNLLIDTKKMSCLSPLWHHQKKILDSISPNITQHFKQQKFISPLI